MKINLEKHDRISFFGDSITAHGMWIREVAEYFVQKYPELEIGIYNSAPTPSTINVPIITFLTKFAKPDKELMLKASMIS